MEQANSSKTIRLDKWLKIARIFKTRSKAGDACSQGKVKVNDQVAKAAKVIKIGDTVAVRLKSRTRTFDVLDIVNKSIKAADARLLYNEHELSPEEKEAEAAIEEAKVTEEAEGEEKEEEVSEEAAEEHKEGAEEEAEEEVEEPEEEHEEEEEEAEEEVEEPEPVIIIEEKVEEPEPEEDVSANEPEEEGCDHSNLPIAFKTTVQGIKRYHYYCQICGYKSPLIRHAELPDDHSNFIDLMKD